MMQRDALPMHANGDWSGDLTCETSSNSISIVYTIGRRGERRGEKEGEREREKDVDRRASCFDCLLFRAFASLSRPVARTLWLSIDYPYRTLPYSQIASNWASTTSIDNWRWARSEEERRVASSHRPWAQPRLTRTRRPRRVPITRRLVRYVRILYTIVATLATSPTISIHHLWFIRM